jgi:hypothetical protein
MANKTAAAAKLTEQERAGEARRLVEKIREKEAVVGGFLTTGREFPHDAVEYPRQIRAMKAQVETLTGEPYADGARTTAEAQEFKPAGQLSTQKEKAAEKAELVRELRAFAEQRSELPYVQPEAAMAASVAQQLEAGAKVIDLTQRYGTGDPAAAAERHRDALCNMASALKVVAKHSERIDEGKGIAHGPLKQTEIMAINQNFKRGLANGGNILRTAGQHQQHSVQAPRLSISGEGLGGGI